MGTFPEKYLLIWPFVCFWGVLCFPFLVTENHICLMGSITSINRGVGSDPLRKNSITNPFFLRMASLKVSGKFLGLSEKILENMPDNWLASFWGL